MQIDNFSAEMLGSASILLAPSGILPDDYLKIPNTRKASITIEHAANIGWQDASQSEQNARAPIAYLNYSGTLLAA